MSRLFALSWEDMTGSSSDEILSSLDPISVGTEAPGSGKQGTRHASDEELYSSAVLYIDVRIVMLLGFFLGMPRETPSQPGL